MLTVHQLVEIASRHYTRMADAMIAACVTWADAHGVTLLAPVEAPYPGAFELTAEMPAEDVDWERMVAGNRDTHWNHC